MAICNTLVTLEAEWAGMPSEWKFFVHSWIFEVHSKKIDCILSAFQIFGPIPVAGPNVLLMLKTFEVHSKWRNIEHHLKCILTALWLHSKYSYGPLRHSNSIWNILIAFEGESKRQAISNPARISWMRLEWAWMHLECISIAAGIYFDIKRIPLKCNSNAVGIFRLPLECSLNVPTPDWPSNESGRNSEHRRIAYPGIYKEFPFRRHSGSFRL